MIDQHFVFAGSVVSFFGSASYVRAVFAGKAQPNLVTWTLWALAPLLAFAIEAANGVGLPAVMTLTVGLGPLMITVAGVLNHTGRWRPTRFDYLCGSLSILGLIGWLVTQHGTVGLVASITADGLAGLPTMRKAWNDPSTEHPLAFMLGAANALITLATLKTWTLASAGFPVYIALACATLVLLCVAPRRALSSRAATART